MAVSLIGLFIPGRLLRPAKNPLQLLAAMQWAVHDQASAVEEAVRTHVRTAVSGEEFDRVDRERAALENRLVAMEAQIAELQQALEAVSGWRARGLPSSTRLISARVVSADAIGWRESIQIDRGSSDGVAVGDWVVSHGFPPPAGGGDKPGGDRLSSECLLGQVAETAPLTSRVILLSDPYLRPPTRVRVARLEAGRISGPEDGLVLYGAGGGAMTVPDVPASLCDAGKVRVGDLVITTRGEARLPIPMVVGRIERIDRDPKNPLLYRLSVRPRLDTRAIRQAYVVSMSSAEK